MSEKTNVSRRAFLGASVALASSAALLSSVGCTNEGTVEPTVKHELPTDPTEGGKWVSAACWHNCGGRCMNKVMVKDGVVIRQKTDDTHEDTYEYPQQRGCVRGKAQQQQCFGADRILHPLKRKNWKPGGGDNSNGQLRGKDEWEVISWDEAIDLACQEIKRISDAYGPTGFFCKSPDASVNLICGCIREWDTSSHGTYTLKPDMIGLPTRDVDYANDRFDMVNADYIVMWASNPTWSAAGNPINYYMNARDAGAKFICVDPLYNASAQLLEAEWIPCRNGEDMALMLATAYEMMRLDEEEGDIVDWDFLDKYTVGFDAEHMPADAKLNENLKDYIMGEYDGIAKTPAWAEPICGVPASQITSFARILGKKNNVMILHNYGFVRCNGAEMIPQMLIGLGAMGGHIGKSGNACSGSYHARCGNPGPLLVTAGSAKTPTTSNPISTGVRVGEIYDVINNGGGEVIDVANAYGAFHAPIPTTLGPIKCIIHTTDAGLQTSTNQKAGIEAHRKVDFVLSRAQFMTTNARYSDIILPVTTEWETVGGFGGWTNREYLQCYTQVTEPLGEAKTDQEIARLLVEGMGMDPDLAFNTSEKQQFFEKIAGCTVMGNGGSSKAKLVWDEATKTYISDANVTKPLVTITNEDIASWGVTGTAQEGVIGLQDFLDNGGFQYERSQDDGQGFIGYKEYIEDPENNPRPSKSGKFEIYCQARFDLMESFGFKNIELYKPYPTYVPGIVGYETTFKNGVIGGEKGEYPYIMYNPHYLRRSHSVFDNCPWLRETWENPVFLSQDDADEKGIKEGDTVLISTPYGKSIRRAVPMDILIPGVVGVCHGAWVDVDEQTDIDQAGSDNYLIGSNYGGMGVNGYNNQNCNIEKYNGVPLGRDCDLAPRWNKN